MARGKGRLSDALVKQQSQTKHNVSLKRKMENRDIHYSKDSKKKKFEKKEIPKNVEELPPVDERKVFIPFQYNDRILIIGDGDFSYSLSVIKLNLIKSANLITTSFDSYEELIEKYGKELIDNNLNELKELGVTKIYHNIDGCKLSESLGISVGNKRVGNKSGKTIEILGGLTVNNIIFNFPHVGQHIKDVNRNIIKNQQLVANFMKSCIEFYSILKKQRDATGIVDEKKDFNRYNKDEYEEYGEDVGENETDGNSTKPILNNNNLNDTEVITITLFEGEPYDSWKIKKIAKDSIKYSVQRSGVLEWRFYKDYHHRRTAGLGETNKQSQTRRARIYKFEKFLQSNSKSKKNRVVDSDDEE